MEAPKGSRLLGIMPTDSLDGIRRDSFHQAHSKTCRISPSQSIAQRSASSDEYRNALYIHSPSTIRISRISVPATLTCISAWAPVRKGSPVKFRVSVEGSSGDIFSKTLDNADQWEDADVDLSRWSGRAVKLQLRTESPHAGDVALWANPLVTTTGQKESPEHSDLHHRYVARRPREPLRLRPGHNSVPEKARRVRRRLRGLPGPGNLDQIVHRISDDVAVFLYARHRLGCGHNSARRDHTRRAIARGRIRHGEHRLHALRWPSDRA